MEYRELGRTGLRVSMLGFGLRQCRRADHSWRPSGPCAPWPAPWKRGSITSIPLRHTAMDNRNRIWGKCSMSSRPRSMSGPGAGATRGIR